MGDLVAISIFGAITAIIIYNSSRRHKERIELIRRGMNPIILPKTGGFALFLGLGGSAVGLALIVSAVLVARSLDRDILMAGIIVLFSGAAFLLYWKLTAGDREKAFRTYERSLAEQDQEKPVQADDVTVDENAQTPE